MSTPIQCGTCRFFQAFSDPKEGYCIFNPPTPVVVPHYHMEQTFPTMEVESAWATVREDEVCGRYSIDLKYMDMNALKEIKGGEPLSFGPIACS